MAEILPSGAQAVGTILSQSATQVSHTGDLLESILATIAVPANALGRNGQLAIAAVVSCTNSANNKTFRLRYGASGSGTGGTSLSSLVLTASATAVLMGRIANRAATNVQGSFANFQGTSTSSGVLLTAAIDTTAATDLNLTGQLGLGTETLALEILEVLLYPAA